MADFMKVDSMRFQQAETRPSGSTEGAAPAASDVDSFEQAMGRVEEREQRGQGQQGGGQDSDSGQEQRDRSLMEAFTMSSPLDGLFGNRMVAENQPATAPAGTPAGPEPSELAQRLVERILVSEPSAGGQEIRLTLGNDVLPGTEISILRDASGNLAVRLVTENASSFQTLVSAQDTLKRQLEGLEQKDVRVEVSSEFGDNRQEGNDSRQRSRGFFEQNDQNDS